MKKNWERMLLLFAFAGRHATIVFLSVLSVGWGAAFYHYGLGFAPDSCNYLQTASFMFHDGNYNTSQTLWPPMYPFLIHLFMYFTPLPNAAAGLASGFSLFVGLLFVALTLKKALRHPPLEFAVFITLLSFACFWVPYYNVWSEGTYLACSAANIYFIFQYFDKRKLAYFILAALFASMTALTRYIGYTLLLNFSLTTFYVLATEHGITKRILIFISMVLSFVPSALWAFRNYKLTETLHGVRSETGVTMLESTHYLINHLKNTLNDPLSWLLFAIFVFFGYRVRRHFTSGTKASSTHALEYYVFGYGIIFTGILIYSSAQSNLNLIGTRLLHPIYPLLLLFAGIGLSQMRETIEQPKPRTIVSICCALALLSGAGTNSTQLSKDFFDISKVKRGTNRITDVGFEKNQNAMEMANRFWGALENHSRILAVHIDNTTKDPRSYYGYGFFSRRVMWDSPLISNIKIRNIPPPLDKRTREAELRTFGFDVSLNYTRSKRQVFYRGLPRLGNLNALADKLEELLKKTKATYAFVIESYVDDKNNTAIVMQRNINQKRKAGRLEVTTLFNRDRFAVHRFEFPATREPQKKPSASSIIPLRYPEP
ncbi:MAG: glycosyltransferase family 39 protein [Deltaproteobacteria bacterium]|nr:glycosyltransferase family 39 protein [Deltaproteobacteria bacterium]